jgi:AcrR family transcriptional regulator
VRSPVGEGKQRLLEALFDEFDENGPSPNLSIRYIAEWLDVHHTLLTYHFGSRAGLLAAVLSEARRRRGDASRLGLPVVLEFVPESGVGQEEAASC